jgi:hypothetical protein
MTCISFGAEFWANACEAGNAMPQMNRHEMKLRVRMFCIEGKLEVVDGINCLERTNDYLSHCTAGCQPATVSAAFNIES